MDTICLLCKPDFCVCNGVLFAMRAVVFCILLFAILQRTKWKWNAFVSFVSSNSLPRTRALCFTFCTSNSARSLLWCKFVRTVVSVFRSFLLYFSFTFPLVSLSFSLYLVSFLAVASRLLCQHLALYYALFCMLLVTLSRSLALASSIFSAPHPILPF